MPKVGRPDLLPLALPKRIGLPFHGRVTNSKLALPDTTEMDYLQPDGADLTYVEHPKAAAPARLPSEVTFDAAKNYQWLPYAYVSGFDRQIGTKSLRTEASTTVYDYWLYCSENRTFLIRCQKTQLFSQVSLTISALEFGRFGIDESAYRSLGTHIFTLLDYNDSAVTTTAYYQGVTHDKTGAITVINLSTNGFVESFGFAGAIKIVVSGDTLNELEMAGTTLCAGSQVATVTTTDENVDSFTFYGACGDLPFDCNVWNIRADADVHITVTASSYDPGPPAKYHSEYSYSFYSNEPLVGSDIDLKVVSAKIYWYVLPNGGVSHIDAEYKSGYEDYHVTTIPEDAVSGVYDRTVGGAETYSPSEVREGSVTKDYFNGVEATIGPETWAVRRKLDCVTTVSMRYDFSSYLTTSADWSDSYLVCKPYGYSSAVDDVAGSSGVYEPQWISESEATAINIGDENDHPKVFYYCNNILDVYHFQDYGNKLHYLYSITISGKSFSRLRERSGDVYYLYPALWDPRTDTVYIGNPGDSMSIV